LESEEDFNNDNLLHIEDIMMLPGDDLIPLPKFTNEQLDEKYESSL